MQTITQYLNREGYNVMPDNYYSYIDLWFKWYKGKVWSFHNYRQYNGSRTINRVRKSVGIAKKVCEDWANLALNEKVGITIDDEKLNEVIQAVLMRNKFRVKGNQLLELTYALGTGAFVEYIDRGEVCMDYIRAGMIYPINWDNGDITECAFAGERVEGKQRLIYLNIHERDINGEYVVKNRMLIRNNNSLTPTDLPDGMTAEYNTHSRTPLFQIVTPNIVNNIDPDCPMGISVFANAIDQMEGLDLIYDSYCNEFRLGKKRIVVPVSMSRMIQEDSGLVRPAFDDNDTEFYALDMEGESKPYEINMELRADAHEMALKTALNLVSSKCGLGNDRFNFEKGGIKTATEVISEKSDMFQNLKKHELLLEDVLCNMVKAIAMLLGIKHDFEVNINFDDSIIEDTTAKKQQYLQEIRDGIRQKWEYRVEFYGEDEKTARAMIESTQTDNDIMGFGGDN